VEFPPASRPRERFVFIDGLRGIAALYVAVFHFWLLADGLSGGAVSGVTPGALTLLLMHGDLGVDIFFVISGFVISYSMLGERIGLEFIRTFALRRSLRLDPPYWIVLASVVLIRVIEASVFRKPVELPSPWTFTTNVMYLQDIMGTPNLLSISWTLCLEIQFYLVYVLLLAIVQRAFSTNVRLELRLAAVFGPVFVISGAFLYAQATAHGVFINYWYAFFLGALTCWALYARTGFGVWAATTTVVLVATAITRQPQPAAVAGAAALIYVAGRLGRLTTWLRAGPLQYLGGISYSLYLVHAPFGWGIVGLGNALAKSSVLAHFGSIGLAIGASIVLAHLLRSYVEVPGIQLGRRLTSGAPARSMSVSPVAGDIQADALATPPG